LIGFREENSPLASGEALGSHGASITIKHDEILLESGIDVDGPQLLPETPSTK
jgi:hypothetical protein